MSTDYYLYCQKCDKKELIFIWDAEGQRKRFARGFIFEHDHHNDIIVLPEHDSRVDPMKNKEVEL